MECFRLHHRSRWAESLLLSARYNNPGSPFFKDSLPLDIFKFIYRQGLLAITEDIISSWDAENAPFLYKRYETIELGLEPLELVYTPNEENRTLKKQKFEN